MKGGRWVIFGVVLALTLGVLVWLGRDPSHPLRPVSADAASTAAPKLRIALVPERDIFLQRQRYVRVTEYLSAAIDQPVELVTLRSYRDVIGELRERRVDGAFLGSLITTIAVDRVNARVLVRPESAGGGSTYRGVVFVPEASPIRTVDDLAGRSIAMVPTTFGSCLFPITLLVQNKLLDQPNRPQLVYVGTHDDAILEVIDGRADAGAVKDARLDEFLRDHPQHKVRRLATSEPAPENSLVVRSDLPGELVDRLSGALLAMHEHRDGQTALGAFGAKRFIPCKLSEYDAVYQLVERVGSAWNKVDALHPPPWRRSGAMDK